MAASEAEEPPSHFPSYSEMISAAISHLNEKGGSSKSAISRYMESVYRGLPATHPVLLADNLSRMRDSGDLVVVKNSYFLPGPDAPQRRGRGRPPKPRDPSTDPPTPRPRGRPPKAKDPLAAAIAKVAEGYPRPRGRPPKPRADGEEPPKQRPRGRPHRIDTPLADVGFV